ncbi:hypothetical protein NXS19_000310 [Fusarium pseudograminearum]|nr:hypothetical protein NXS19_000310 [Fusarium pseudograminearum]
MKVIRHDIDPDGDLLIVLKCPNSLNLMPHLPLDGFPWPPPHYGSILVDLSNKDNVQIEFRVFSLLMLRSSMFFRKMLTSPWKETVEESATSPRLLRVSATDWNADALAVVLDIIHNCSYENDIPHGLSNFFLAHIAAIVDYYQWTIENKRQAILGKLLARIDAIAPGIWEDRTGCSDECYLSMRRRLPTVFPRLPVSRSLIGCSIIEVLKKIDDLLPAHEHYHGGDCGVNSMMYEAIWEMDRDVRQASYETFKDSMQ